VNLDPVTLRDEIGGCTGAADALGRIDLTLRGGKFGFGLVKARLNLNFFSAFVKEKWKVLFLLNADDLKPSQRAEHPINIRNANCLCSCSVRRN
jgi:hypothetical protein